MNKLKFFYDFVRGSKQNQIRAITTLPNNLTDSQEDETVTLISQVWKKLLKILYIVIESSQLLWAITGRINKHLFNQQCSNSEHGSRDVKTVGICYYKKL